MKRLLLAATLSTFWLAAAPDSQQTAPAPEVRTQDEGVVFESKVTLIDVPVVVRDKNHKTAGGLRQEDFLLFDKGKPQVIVKFSVEKRGNGRAIPQVSAPGRERTPDGKGGAASVTAPDHFVGFLFDDLHMRFEDLAYTRIAVQKFIASNLKQNDRIAIFTTSGQTQLEFTDDRELMNKVVVKISPHPVEPPPGCPGLSFLEADRIHDLGDSELRRRIARGIVHVCAPDLPSAEAKVSSQAAFVMHMYEQTLQVTAGSLMDVVNRMAQMPGQRSLVMASSGFLSPPQMTNMGPVINRAIRAGVIINTLDARGLSTQNDAGAGWPTSVLAELASGTGGRFIQNTNDLTGGIQELGAAPEVYYVLGFSPQNMKFDGAFHALKVNLRSPSGLSVQARLGYYAPTQLATAEEDAKEEVTQALFSRDETGEIPVEMNTRFFKTSESEARLSVTSRVDVRKLRFHKLDGRNINNVRVVCGLFDRNGNFVQGAAKMIQLRLLDDTLQKDKLSGGIAVRSDFTVAPGAYVIRLVVRDAEGRAMTAQNGAVKIP